MVGDRRRHGWRDSDSGRIVAALGFEPTGLREALRRAKAEIEGATLAPQTEAGRIRGQVRKGGVPGILDQGFLESALAPPRNLVGWEADVIVSRLAALYGLGIAKAHAFADGNKRIAFAIMVAFLKAHGRRLDATEADAVDMMFQAVAGEVSETELEKWIEAQAP